MRKFGWVQICICIVIFSFMSASANALDCRSLFIEKSAFDQRNGWLPPPSGPELAEYWAREFLREGANGRRTFGEIQTLAERLYREERNAEAAFAIIDAYESVTGDFRHFRGRHRGDAENFRDRWQQEVNRTRQHDSNRNTNWNASPSEPSTPDANAATAMSRWP